MNYKDSIGSGRIYIIAEIGGNFLTFEEAKIMIDAAKTCGADAVKLQTYQADTLASRTAMFAFETTGNTSQYDMFKKYEVGESLHKEVFAYAQEKGLEVFSTPSHRTDVELLEHCGCPIYKVGSDDATNIPFLRELAQLGKPILLATGMCTLSEVEESVSAMQEEGCQDISLLHAISLYPTHDEDVNLQAMTTMKKKFPLLPVGYSDHTIGITACVCAAAMGAQIIEKHFTYNKNAEGPDHIHSADPAEMKRLVSAVRQFEVMKGTGIKSPAAGEILSRVNNRKSVVLTKPVKAGERLAEACFGLKRPGSGILPKDVRYAIGREFVRDMEADEIVKWEDLK